MDTKKLRQKILDLAIHGKLVPQDPNDEPASVLLERIRAEKERLIAEGKIKRSKKSVTSDTSHYENVPFEVPDGWSWCTLDDLAFYKKGPFGSSLTKSMFVPDSPSAYKVYEQKNAIQKDHTLGSYFIDEEKYRELSGFKVEPNDIIVSCAGTIGETYIMPNDIREGIINQALMLIRLHLKDIQDFYLLYFDFILKAEAAKESKGTAIKNIPPFDVLKSFLIPIPPLAEQGRILEEVNKLMSFVDSIDVSTKDISSLINSAKSKILDLAIHGKLVQQDANDEPASVLLKRINPKTVASCDNPQYGKVPSSWVISTVGEVFTINPKTRVEDDTEAAFVPMTCVADGYSNTFEYECRKWGDIKKGFVHFQENDVAVAKISPCLENRKSVVFHDLPNGIGAGTTELNVFRCEEILPEYALFYFKSQMFIGSCAGTYNGVVGQQRVAKSFIQELPIGIPPYNEQLRIVSKINELFSQLDMIEKSLQA